MVIQFTRGDNHQVRFKFKTFTGEIEKMYFTVRCQMDRVRIQKKLGDGIEYKDGWYTINFIPEDTDGLICGTPMKYDIEIIVDSEKYTIIKDTLMLEEDITTPAEEV